MSLTTDLQNYARETGIPLVGITSAEPFLDLREFLSRRRLAGRQSPFEWEDINMRSDPRQMLPGARSVIAVGLPYPASASAGAVPAGQSPVHKALPRETPAREKGSVGRMARVAWGRDYHRVMQEALAKLAGFLQEQSPGMTYREMVDTGPLVDRAVAQRAGIGWQGKNCMIITEDYGSWLAIGELITDVPLDPGQPVSKNCGTCARCLAACPTGALAQPYELHPFRCLSYATQARGYIQPEFRQLIGNRIYGCDICQEACPYNQDTGRDKASCTPTTEGWHFPDLMQLLQVTKEEFTRRYAPTAAGWVGRQVLRRNTMVGLGNSGDPDAVPILAVALQDPSSVLRGHAAWALGRIGGVKARAHLDSARWKEADQTARAEINQALETIR